MCFFILYNVKKERGESNGDEEGGPTAYYKYVTGLLMKSLHFTNHRTRRRYQRRRERADGVLLLRRGPLDEVYDALYAF